MDIAGIVLAGGQSKRYGSPKAFEMKDGIPFYQHSINALDNACSTIMIVTQLELTEQFQTEHKIITDITSFKGQGPLAGIYSAMENTPAEWYVILPTDTPFVTSNVIAQLVGYQNSEVQAIVPIVTDQVQPLIASYHISVKEHVKEQLLLGKRSLHNLLEKLKVKYVTFDDEKPFFNINRKEDFFWF
jgi:molybdenum cofactor guanylyltransferase